MNYIHFPLLVTIILGTHYEHDFYGRVKITDIQPNTGDKAYRIPYMITFKPEFGKVESQGIKGFIGQSRKSL